MSKRNRAPRETGEWLFVSVGTFTPVQLTRCQEGSKARIATEPLLSDVADQVGAQALLCYQNSLTEVTGAPNFTIPGPHPEAAANVGLLEEPSLTQTRQTEKLLFQPKRKY